MADEEATDEQNEAAAKIQAAHRGKRARKHAKKKKDEKEKEEQRKADNPKLGDSAKPKVKVDPLAIAKAPLSGGKDLLVDGGAVVAENSVEFMLKMFGKDGGAYLRKNSQRSCRDLPMCFSFAMVWTCMIYLMMLLGLVGYGHALCTIEIPSPTCHYSNHWEEV